MPRMFNLSYRKVGGLHFMKLGRFGCSFYIARRYNPLRTHRADALPVPTNNTYTRLVDASAPPNMLAMTARPER